jgi:hypothetical protein
MGKLSRVKGARFEVWLATRCRLAFRHDAIKRLGCWQRRGAEMADVEIPPSGSVPLLWLEAKVGKQTNPRAALVQAKNDLAAANRPYGGVPVAVCKDDGGTPFVIMDLDDWLRITALARAGDIVLSATESGAVPWHLYDPIAAVVRADADQKAKRRKPAKEPANAQ